MFVRFVSGLAIVPVATLPSARAAEQLLRPVLILVQNGSDSVRYGPFSVAFRSTLYAAASARPISINAE